MIIKAKIDNQKILDLALKKIQVDDEITKLLQEENEKFSRKKLVADLGEYHAKKNIEHFFEKLKFSETRVSRCDMIGTLKDKFAKQWNLPKDVKIEVKTRYDQKGLPHLANVDKSQFDLLVFVSLNSDYSIHYIGMVKSMGVQVSALKKVIYSSKLNPVFATEKEFVPHS
jgi:hypothetical protein